MSKTGLVFVDKPVFVPIDQLRLASWNYKAEPDAWMLERFTESVRRGVTPLHVAGCSELPEEDKTLEVCDGNNRLKALKLLGAKRILVYKHGRLSLAERKELALRYNAKWFIEVTVPLAECLRDVLDALPDATLALPYEQAETDRLLAALNVDLVTEEEPLSAGLGADKAETKKATVDRGVRQVTCPHCNGVFNL